VVGLGVERSFVCSWLVDFVAAMDGDEDGDGDDSGGGGKEREVIYWGSKHEKETWHSQMDKLWGGSRDVVATLRHSWLVRAGPCR
jgi:hypothetical protein